MMKIHHLKVYIGIGIILTGVILLTGCFQRSKAPYVVDRYILDYPAPVIPGLTFHGDLIRIERFSVAHSFNSMAMVFKPQAFHFDTYGNSRWSANPGDMAAESLTRDLRKAGLFGGVFSYQSDEPVRFVLEGAVEEFCESYEGSASKAVLAITVMLLDKHEMERGRRLRFNKTYRYSSPLDRRSPEGLAKGMSVNVAAFSEQLIKDLNFALK